MNDQVTQEANAVAGSVNAATSARPDRTMLPTLDIELPLTEPMDEEQIARIDAASLDILEEVGVVFRDDIA